MKELLEYRKRLLDRFEQAADEFRNVCLAVSDPFKSFQSGGWNVHQIAVHVRDVDNLVYGLRIHRTLEVDDPEFQNFDADPWMDEHYDRDEPLESILEEFTTSVHQTIERLRDLPPEAWSRESRHTVYGSGFTMQSWVERDLEHIQEHLETIKKAQ
jgi:hypothetical protein